MLKQNICILISEFKIKWMGKSIKDATWEPEDTIKTNFPNFSLQEYNVLKTRVCYGHDHKLSHGKFYRSILHTRIKCEG